jgi:hypothetical protein
MLQWPSAGRQTVRLIEGGKPEVRIIEGPGEGKNSNLNATVSA